MCNCNDDLMVGTVMSLQDENERLEKRIEELEGAIRNYFEAGRDKQSVAGIRRFAGAIAGLKNALEKDGE